MSRRAPTPACLGGDVVGGKLIGRRRQRLDAERPKPGAICQPMTCSSSATDHAAQHEHPLAVAGQRHHERIVPHALFQRIALDGPLLAARVAGDELGRRIVGCNSSSSRVSQIRLPVCQSTATTFSGVRITTTSPTAIGRAPGITTTPRCSEVVAAAGEIRFDRRIVDDARLPPRPKMRPAARLLRVAGRIAAHASANSTFAGATADGSPTSCDEPSDEIDVRAAGSESAFAGQHRLRVDGCRSMSERSVAAAASRSPAAS